MRRKIAAIILLALIYTSITPIARASILSDIKDGAVCFGTGWVVNWITDKIADKIWGAVESVVGDEVPTDDSVVRREQRKQTTKERNLDLIARCVARTFLDKEIAGILNIAKKYGPDGGPLHIRNWRNFQTNAQYRGEAVFRAILTNTQLCDYFNQDLKKLYGVSMGDKVSLKGQNTRIGDLDPFTLQAKCTLPVGFDIKKYQEDFAKNGGWAAFERLLQPENNPYGVALLAIDELNKQQEMETSTAVNAAIANSGYEGLRGSSAQESCSVRDKNGRCVFYKDIKLPGDYISGSLEATVNAELSWLTNADELNEVIVRLTNRLVARMLNFDKDEQPPQYEGDIEAPITSPIIPTPTPRPPGPESCTGGNPLCSCVTDDPAYSIYSDAISAAEDLAAVNRPDLIDSSGGTVRVRAGANSTDVLNAICANFRMTGVVCRPHNRQDDEIVLEIPSPREDVSFDVTTSSGLLWANPVAACEPGVH